MMFNKKKFNTEDVVRMVDLLSVMSLILIEIISVVYDHKFSLSGIFLIFVTINISLVFGIFILQILRRVNPKQYIYISYSTENEEIADSISKILSEQFEKLSKYRFEIRTADSVPYGEDMYATVQRYIDESDIIIIIVSAAYIDSEWCRNEFNSIVSSGKKIIPIIMNSYDDLSRLSVDVSNIKALSLQNCTSEKEFESQLLLLAKDLIRQRKD